GFATRNNATAYVLTQSVICNRAPFGRICNPLAPRPPSPVPAQVAMRGEQQQRHFAHVPPEMDIEPYRGCYARQATEESILGRGAAREPAIAAKHARQALRRHVCHADLAQIS